MSHNAVHPDPANWKQQKRKILLAERQQLSQSQSLQWSGSIQNHLYNHLSDRIDKQVISIYWPFKGEPDLRPLAKLIIENGGACALPVVTQKNAPLEFMAYEPGQPLKKGVLNIPIPEQEIKLQPTIILAPAIGFDNGCFRLGYGGGYFDRTLAAFRQSKTDKLPEVIGIAYDQSELDIFHSEPHDIKMDKILTETGIRTGAAV